MDYVMIFLAGIVIGIANIIPGVSGGTMAVVMNIFDRLISAISDLKKNFRKNALFLLLIGVGAIIGILAFSKLIGVCLEYFPDATGFFFVGLILGSIPMIYKRATIDSFKASHLIPFFIALGVMIFTVVVTPDDSGAAVITQLTLVSFLKLFLVSVLASACMIIPGISGSFVMLLLGTYTSVMTAINGVTGSFLLLLQGNVGKFAAQFSAPFLLLVPVIIGCVVGFLGGAKLIKLLLQRYPQATYFTILGLVIGSIPVILKPTFWNDSGFQFPVNLEMLIAVVTLIAGMLLAYFLGSRVKDEKETDDTASEHVDSLT